MRLRVKRGQTVACGGVGAAKKAWQAGDKHEEHHVKGTFRKLADPMGVWESLLWGCRSSSNRLYRCESPPDSLYGGCRKCGGPSDSCTGPGAAEILFTAYAGVGALLTVCGVVGTVM